MRLSPKESRGGRLFEGRAHSNLSLSTSPVTYPIFQTWAARRTKRPPTMPRPHGLRSAPSLAAFRCTARSPPPAQNGRFLVLGTTIQLRSLTAEVNTLRGNGNEGDQRRAPSRRTAHQRAPSAQKNPPPSSPPYVLPSLRGLVILRGFWKLGENPSRRLHLVTSRNPFDDPVSPQTFRM